MPNTTRLAIALLALPLALPLAACDDVQAVPGLAPDLAPKALAEAICPAAYNCCMTDQLMSNDQAGTDLASCEMLTESAFTSQVAGIKASQKKGRVTYDGLKVQACVDFLKTAKCPELTTTTHFTGLPACSSFIQPKVAVGGACGNDFECIDGYCDKTGVADGQDGKCHAFAQNGESCASSVRCAATLTCDTGTTKCIPAPAGAPPANACFYSSACNYAGGDRGAFSLLGIGILLVAVAARRRRARE